MTRERIAEAKARLVASPAKPPFRLGRPGAVVCDQPTEITGGNDPRDVEYYGGHLVCESVIGATRELVKHAPGDLAMALDSLDRAWALVDDPGVHPADREKLRAALEGIT
ncbi:MAG: hypothetical protein ABSD03_17670 [Vulcanimicrobiaceae bacterium]